MVTRSVAVDSSGVAVGGGLVVDGGGGFDVGGGVGWAIREGVGVACINNPSDLVAALVVSSAVALYGALYASPPPSPLLPCSCPMENRCPAHFRLRNLAKA